MLKLTLLDDQPLYIQPGAIEWLTTEVTGGGPNAKCAICTSSGIRFYIKDTVDEVIQMLGAHYEEAPRYAR